jgi:hypothetical protein
MTYAAIRDVAPDESPGRTAMRPAAEPDQGTGSRKDWRDRVLNVLIAALLIQAAVIFLMMVVGLVYMALN